MGTVLTIPVKTIIKKLRAKNIMKKDPECEFKYIDCEEGFRPCREMICQIKIAFFHAEILFRLYIYHKNAYNSYKTTSHTINFIPFLP